MSIASLEGDVISTWVSLPSCRFLPAAVKDSEDDPSAPPPSLQSIICANYTVKIDVDLDLIKPCAQFSPHKQHLIE